MYISCIANAVDFRFVHRIRRFGVVCCIALVSFYPLYEVFNIMTWGATVEILLDRGLQLA